MQLGAREVATPELPSSLKDAPSRHLKKKNGLFLKTAFLMHYLNGI